MNHEKQVDMWESMINRLGRAECTLCLQPHGLSVHTKGRVGMCKEGDSSGVKMAATQVAFKVSLQLYRLTYSTIIPTLNKQIETQGGKAVCT